jgi:protoporphyrinogen oxidase
MPELDRATGSRSATSKPHVIVLGGGPAGCGAAYQLRRLDRATVTLIEAQSAVGGNSGSFSHADQRLDYGSHRLHPACDAAVLADIRTLLDGGLLDRPRHGRIRLLGRWIHFPLKPIDLMLRLRPSFAAGALRDMAMRRVRPGGTAGDESFATVLRESLGQTICDEFYFPYARKIWGCEPNELSAVQARRRVSAGSFMKLIRKVASAVPGLKPPGAGRFYYPREGFGRISEAYAEAAERAGAELLLGWRVAGLVRRGARWVVRIEQGGASAGSGVPPVVRELEADHVWSTLPISQLARFSSPTPDAAVLAAASSLEFRAMLLIYVTLPVPRFTAYDAHYFPESGVQITRLSEPKNYAARGEPANSTTLCAELPCSTDEAAWNASDAQLGEIVARDLVTAGIPLPAAPTSVYVRRLRFAYPVYRRGYETAFTALDQWADTQPSLLTFGRQGLFAHDNTHHALRMAYAAAECLAARGFDDARWAEYRREFEGHVVED